MSWFQGCSCPGTTLALLFWCSGSSAVVLDFFFFFTMVHCVGTSCDALCCRNLCRGVRVVNSELLSLAKVRLAREGIHSLLRYDVCALEKNEASFTADPLSILYTCSSCCEFVRLLSAKLETSANANKATACHPHRFLSEGAGEKSQVIFCVYRYSWTV